MSDNTQSDIQAALTHINAVIADDDWTLISGSPGDTIALTDTLTIEMSHSFTWRSASPANRATITSSYTGGVGIFLLQHAANKVITVEDFRMTDWQVAGRWMQVEGTGEIFRILNCYIRRTSGSEFWLWTSAQGTGVNEGEGPFGLIANNEILYCGIFVRQNLGSPDAEWSNDFPLEWGTRRAVFLEYNTITGRGGPAAFTDGNQAGKLVIRHNNVTDTVVAWHGRDSGASETRCKHSFLAGEIYANTFHFDTTTTAPLVEIRGGTALVYENGLNVTGSISIGAQLQAYCAGGTWGNCFNAADCTPMIGPLTDPNDPQLPGFPTPVRAWSNANKQAFYYNTWCASDNALTTSPSHYLVSDDDSAKPAGYTPFADPHPLNPGPTVSAPSNNVPPSVAGILTAGQTISLLDGSWSGYPAPSFSRQLLQCDENGGSCTEISGATNPNFSLTAEQAGKRLQLRVIASNPVQSAVAYSTLTDVVALPGIENLLQNASFERCSAEDDVVNNVARWTGWQTNNGADYVFPSTDAHGGQRAYRVYRSTDQPAFLAQSFLTTPGVSYILSFWQKTDSATHGIYFTVYDNEGSRYIYGSAAQPSPGAYTKKQVEFKALSSSTAVQFFASLLGGGENIWLDDVVVAPTFAAASREFQGNADEGMSFDLNLPLTGTPAVECRYGADTIVFRFANPIETVTGATVSSGVGEIRETYLSSDGREYVVKLSNVANEQHLSVTLQGVKEATGRIIGSITAGLDFLLGDVNGDGVVNAADATLVRGHSGEATTSGNFRYDVNNDGLINAADATIVRNESGKGLTRSGSGAPPNVNPVVGSPGSTPR
ncbi:MAG: dockerin type I domain-containing protein [Verrucomicrobiota bacterium]|nr:dockerin type I domain-containing protein [Verrucomicrobiota bacterium]